MRSKILSALIVLILAFVVLPAGPSQASAASSGTCGDNLTWTLDSTGTLTISGTGPMYDWASYGEDIPWKENKATIKKVVIGDGITTVGENAFYSCANITSVTLPNSLQEIKNCAFSSCVGLKNVQIPNGVKYIGASAFINSKLTNIRIPGTVETIGSYAFFDSSLENVTLENGIVNINFAAFYWTKIKSVNIPESVRFIDSNAYYSTFPRDTKFYVDLNNQAYSSDNAGALFDKDKKTLFNYPASCESKTYDVPSSVIKIEEKAFFRSSYLTKVVVPQGVEDIGDAVFNQCTNLTSLVLPSSLKHIGTWDTSIKPYMKKTDSGYYVGTNLLFCDYTKNMTYTSSSLQEYTNTIKVKEGTTCIADYAFSNGGSRLKEIELPESAIYLGKGMLDGCSNLQKLILPKGLTEIPDYFTNGCQKLSEISIPSGVKKIGKWAFRDCTSLSSLTIPKSVEEIGEKAFYASGLKNLSLAEGGKLNTIGKNAFTECETLASINLTEGIVTIGEDAFKGCKALQSVMVPSTVTSLGSGAFSGCSALEEIDYRAAEAETSGSSGGVFSGAGNASKGVSVSFSDDVKVIPDDLFSGDTAANVTAVSMGSKVETIGKKVFQNCANFSAITIPSSLRSIGAEAFSGCAGLKDVYFNGAAPETALDSFGTLAQMSETTIYYGSAAGSSFDTTYWKQFKRVQSLTGGICGKSAQWYLNDGALTITGTGPMYGYDSSEKTPWHEYADVITKVYFHGISQIGAYAFSDLPNLQSAQMVTNEVGTGNLTSIGMFAFSNCDALKEITLPDTVTTLGNFVFYGCDGLTSVTLGSGISKIGTAAFYDCVNLEKVYCFTKAPSVGANAFKNCSESLVVRYPADESGWTTPKWNGVVSEPMQVISLSVSRLPAMVRYETGSALNAKGLILLATYDTGDDQVSYSSTVNSGFDLDYDFAASGEQNVEVQYAGCTANFSVNVVEPTVEKLEIVTLPEVMTYEVGNELVTAGLVLRATYSNGEMVQLTDGYTTEYTFDHVGESTVVVRFGDASASFSVTVTEPKLTGISVGTLPSTMVYPLNGELNTTGLEVIGEYSNGTKQTIPTSQCKFAYDFSSPGEKTVTVSYQDFSATFPVTVQGADWPVVSLLTGDAVRGKDVTVSVKIENNTGLGSYTFRLLYDTSSLSYVSYQSDHDGTMRQNYNVSGVLKGQKLVFMGDDAITGDGILATFTFRVSETAPIGEQTITLEVDEATDASGNTRDLYPMSGTIRILERLPGDGNGDGVVRVDDALMVIQYVTGQSSLTEAEQAALDVNGDGAVTLADAVKILRSVVGLSGS